MRLIRNTKMLILIIKKLERNWIDGATGLKVGERIEIDLIFVLH